MSLRLHNMIKSQILCITGIDVQTIEIQTLHLGKKMNEIDQTIDILYGRESWEFIW